jgi:transposase-like protein
MFKHRDAPNCLRCGAALVLHEDGAEEPATMTDSQWKCQDCGSQRPVVYKLERGLKKTA